MRAISIAFAAAAMAAAPAMAGDGDWPVYGHDPGGMRFSPLTQITRENVAQLKIAWTFHTGDIDPGGDNGPRSGFETAPLVIGGTHVPDHAVQPRDRAEPRNRRTTLGL